MPRYKDEKLTLSLGSIMKLSSNSFFKIKKNNNNSRRISLKILTMDHRPPPRVSSFKKVVCKGINNNTAANKESG